MKLILKKFNGVKMFLKNCFCFNETLTLEFSSKKYIIHKISPNEQLHTLICCLVDVTIWQLKLFLQKMNQWIFGPIRIKASTVLGYNTIFFCACETVEFLKRQRKAKETLSSCYQTEELLSIPGPQKPCYSQREESLCRVKCVV